jgi:hypothetical protein
MPPFGRRAERRPFPPSVASGAAGGNQSGNARLLASRFVLAEDDAGRERDTN